MADSKSNTRETSPVEIVSPDDYREWDRFVDAHAWGNFYHTSSWISVLENSFPHMRGFILAMRSGATRQIVAGIPLVKVSSPLLGTRLIGVPLGNYCDPLFSTDAQFKVLWGSVLSLKDREGARSVELKPYRSLGTLQMSGLSFTQKFKHHLIHLDQSLEDLKRSMSKTAIRHMITKAEKAGIDVRRFHDMEACLQFHDIWSQTRKRLGLPPIPAKFFQNLQSTFTSDQVGFWIAFAGSRPAASALVMTDGGLASVEFAGDVQGFRKSGVNQLLYWKILCHARDRKVPLLTLGRTSPDNTSLLQYKRRWGCEELDLPVVNHPLTVANKGLMGRFPGLAKCARTLLSTSPRFVHRLTGALFYRHWG